MVQFDLEIEVNKKAVRCSIFSKNTHPTTYKQTGFEYLNGNEKRILKGGFDVEHIIGFGSVLTNVNC